MTQDLGATLAAIEALNSPESPYRFAMAGTTVTGTWTLVNASFGEGASAGAGPGSIEKRFTVTVSLDPATGTYTVAEGSSGSAEFARPAALPSAMTGKQWSSSTTKGHVVKRSFGTVRSPEVVSGGEVTSRVDYGAVNTQLTGPMEAALGAVGWQRKKGRLARLFGF